MSIPTSTTIEVFADPDYHYALTASEDAFILRYFEGKERKMEREVFFASAEEMEAVACAMLKAVKAHRED